ncbi:hypothetical protein KSP39_PZI005734 [Platanthera zijinensis]|uniref:Uncharacterized protein n=1 Tax=Platanthera zijinensis TaxID=2320716 RepID=A0AAP0BR08_9ASPA
MLSAVIRSALGYPAFTVGMITSTPEVHPSQSSRTRERSSQCNNVCTGYRPNCHPVQDAPPERSSLSSTLSFIHDSTPRILIQQKVIEV